MGNFRAALDWCQAQGYGDACLRLAADLEWFCGANGHITEARTRLETLLTRFPLRENGGARAGVHARALLAAGRLALLQRDFDASVDWLQRSLELYEALGDRAGICDALQALAIVGQEQDDMRIARPPTERSLEVARALAAAHPDDASTVWRVGASLIGMALVTAREGDPRASAAYTSRPPACCMASATRRYRPPTASILRRSSVEAGTTILRGPSLRTAWPASKSSRTSVAWRSR